MQKAASISLLANLLARRGIGDSVRHLLPDYGLWSPSLHLLFSYQMFPGHDAMWKDRLAFCVAWKENLCDKEHQIGLGKKKNKSESERSDWNTVFCYLPLSFYISNHLPSGLSWGERRMNKWGTVLHDLLVIDFSVCVMNAATAAGRSNKMQQRLKFILVPFCSLCVAEYPSNAMFILWCLSDSTLLKDFSPSFSSSFLTPFTPLFRPPKSRSAYDQSRRRGSCTCVPLVFKFLHSFSPVMFLLLNAKATAALQKYKKWSKDPHKNGTLIE